MRSKILSRQSLLKKIRELKKKNKKIVFTNGCYDILHIGHIRLLEKAKSLGDILILAINSDSSIKRLKGPKRPVVGEKQRAEVAAAVEYVDYVTVFSEDTPINLIRKIIPDILIKGADWKNKPLGIVGSNLVKKVVAFPVVKGFSVTNLIKKIKSSC